jgi:hypothetical protein
LVDGGNLFAYVRGNPVGLSDPGGNSGRGPDEIRQGIKAAVAERNAARAHLDRAERGIQANSARIEEETFNLKLNPGLREKILPVIKAARANISVLTRDAAYERAQVESAQVKIDTLQKEGLGRTGMSVADVLEAEGGAELAEMLSDAARTRDLGVEVLTPEEVLASRVEADQAAPVAPPASVEERKAGEAEIERDFSGMPTDEEFLSGAKTTLPEEPPPPSSPGSGGAAGAIAGIGGSALTVLSFYPILKSFVQEDDGTVPFLAVPGQAPPIVNPRKYFEVRMRKLGLDVKKLEGHEIFLGKKSFIVKDGILLPTT